MESPKYGIAWSQGLGVAAVATVALWLPVALVVNHHFAEAWWYDYALAMILLAALATLAGVTCTVSAYLERQRKQDSI